MLPEFAKTVLKSFAETAFPASKTGRPRAVNTDVMIDYFFYMLRTGVQWRLLPVQNDISGLVLPHACEETIGVKVSYESDRYEEVFFFVCFFFRTTFFRNFVKTCFA